MSLSATETNTVKGALRIHLARHDAKGDAKILGNLQQLQTVVKITDSDVVKRALANNTYPVLGQRQYLIACLYDGQETTVWGVYTKAQISTIEAIRRCVVTVEWKVLEIPEALEQELRRAISDDNRQPSCSCTLL